MALPSRTPIAMATMLSLLLCGAAPALAKMPCSEVMAGIAKAGPGKTPDEVATQLGIPVKRVKVCRRKAAQESTGAAGTAAPAAGAPAAAAKAPDDDGDE